MEVITVPSKEDTVDAVIKLALLPVALDVAGRVLQLIEISARSMPPHETAEILYRIGKGAEGSVIAMAEARVILRGAGYRYNFSLEAIFARLAVGSGLSGVTLRGKIDWTTGRAIGGGRCPDESTRHVGVVPGIPARGPHACAGSEAQLALDDLAAREASAAAFG